MKSEATHIPPAKRVARALRSAAPIMAGYVAIGIPCGILSSGVGLSAGMVFLLSMTFYSGAGQFMLANLLAAGISPVSVILSISAVSSRQLLYSACFAPFFAHEGRLKTFLFASTVTDESFGVNLARFETSDAEDGPWEASDGLLLNVFCLLSWAFPNLIGALLGSWLSIPIALSSFAMTSIFIYMLAVLPASRTNLLVAAVSAAVVVACKLAGLTGPAILIGAASAIVAGVVFQRVADE